MISIGGHMDVVLAQGVIGGRMRAETKAMHTNLHHRAVVGWKGAREA